MDEFYLVTAKRTLKGYRHECDRDYFSRPVRVELLYSQRSTRLVWVRDPSRGHEYPALPKEVIPGYRLSKKQLASATR